MSIRKIALCAMVLGFAGVTSAYAGSLEVKNHSNKTIYNLYLSSSADKNWGPDQMGDNADDTIAPGGSFTLTDIEDGDYDVKLVTKKGTECEIDNVKFSSDMEWDVDNDMLSGCAD
jgi:hypothetical protein